MKPDLQKYVFFAYIWHFFTSLSLNLSSYLSLVLSLSLSLILSLTFSHFFPFIPFLSRSLSFCLSLALIHNTHTHHAHSILLSHCVTRAVSLSYTMRSHALNLHLPKGGSGTKVFFLFQPIRLSRAERETIYPELRGFYSAIVELT